MSCGPCEKMQTTDIRSVVRGVVGHMVGGHQNVAQFLRELEKREKDVLVLSRIRADIAVHEQVVEMLRATEAMRRDEEGKVNERDQDRPEGQQGTRQGT